MDLRRSRIGVLRSGVVGRVEMFMRGGGREVGMTGISSTLANESRWSRADGDKTDSLLAVWMIDIHFRFRHFAPLYLCASLIVVSVIILLCFFSF